MPLDPNISLGYKPADPFTTIGSMLNVANAAQQYQQAQQINPLQVQTAQEQLRQAVAINPFLLRSAQVQAETSEKTAPFTVSAAESTAATAKTGSEKSALDLANARVNGIASRLTGLINNPLIIASEKNPAAVNPEQLAGMLKKYGQEQARALGISPEQAEQLIAPYIEQAETNPAGTRRYLIDKLLATLDQGARASTLQPSGVGVNTGAQGYQVQTNIFGPQPGQVVPGTAYEAQLPPNQPQVNPQSGVKSVIGPLSQRVGGGPVVTEVGPAQTAALAAQGSVVSSDWQNTATAASAAPQRIAVFQNIKRLAPEAFTGPTAERRQAVASFAQMLGIPVATLETAATDELMKNTALLQMAGGNTDAARELAKFANPNNKMTKEGIERVTNQLIGMENMAVAKSKFLQPFSSNADQYAARLQDWQDVSDPRLFQEMSQSEFKSVWNSMTPKEREEIKRKQAKARSLGIL